MITKGSAEYKKVQEMANEISRMAATTKRNASYWDIAYDTVGRFVFRMKSVEGFASKIAETVDNSMNPGAFQVARISDKQAWILACSAVENNIEL